MLRRIAGTRPGQADGSGPRTHVLLVLAMGFVIAMATGVSLLLVQHRLRAQVADDLTQDLGRSVASFEALQAVRLQALERENALLADLPTLKALMTSRDDLTIRDGAVQFWKLSGNDLFALADPHGRVVAAYSNGALAGPVLRDGLGRLLASATKTYLIDGNALYFCSVRPLYFGSEERGSLLGFVVSGVSIERSVRQISADTSVDATFLSDGQIVASTLVPELQENLRTHIPLVSSKLNTPATMQLGSTRFLAAGQDLSATATSPLRLVVLKSLEPAERWIARMDRLVLAAGLLALLLGTTLMVALSRVVTRPLEQLSEGVRAFGTGDGLYTIPAGGTREVRQLSRLFAGMRDEIRSANHALLESERLATIGRMAGSVSHDLRHYLAAVFANAEFLASDHLKAEERTEIFADIRTAVDGITEMIESLLIFSRTGQTRHASELMSTLLERAALLTRAHPDAEGIHVIVQSCEPADTAVYVEGKQIERAIYNLLLNACQSVRTTAGASTVTAVLETRGEQTILRVIDDGEGVSSSIHNSLFEPFVSEGKQKGTGLGLTLAHTIATEHGGMLILAGSRPGETVFELHLPRLSQGPVAALDSQTTTPHNVLT